MNTFVKQHKLGVCFVSEGSFRLASDPDTVRAPDVSFVRAEHTPASGIPRRGLWPGAPDLAVEMLSPSNPPGEMWRRIGDLLNAGTRLIWMIHPERRTAVVIRASGDILTLGEDGVLERATRLLPPPPRRARLSDDSAASRWVGWYPRLSG
jgi:Uma2 family endonuclease